MKDLIIKQDRYNLELNRKIHLAMENYHRNPSNTNRYFEDLTLFRIGTGRFKAPLNGFHRELLLSKGSILKEIGFDRKTITEDFAFAREVLRNKM